MKPDRENTPSTDDSVRRIATGLGTALRLAGISKRACERELGLTTGYLTRILAGEVHLRVRVVLELCRILGLPPAAFFAALFPDPPVSETTARLLGGLAAVHPQPDSSPESLHEALLQLREVVRTIETHLAGSALTEPPAR